MNLWTASAGLGGRIVVASGGADGERDMSPDAAIARLADLGEVPAPDQSLGLCAVAIAADQGDGGSVDMRIRQTLKSPLPQTRSLAVAKAGVLVGPPGFVR